MYKKLIMACIFILVITVAACKSKNINGDDTTASDLQEDTKTDESKDVSADGDSQEDSDDAKESEINETNQSQSDSEKEDTKDERKNTYQDVDIKVPSIHED